MRVLSDHSDLVYHTRVLHSFYFVEPFYTWLQEQKNGDVFWSLEHAFLPAAIQSAGRLLEKEVGSSRQPRFNLMSLLKAYEAAPLAASAVLNPALKSLVGKDDTQRIIHLRHTVTSHSGTESTPKRNLRDQKLDETITRGQAILVFIQIAKLATSFLKAGSSNGELPIFNFGSDPDVRARQIVCRLYLSERQFQSETWREITGEDQPEAIWS
jgi:hypothetical protein